MNSRFIVGLLALLLLFVCLSQGVGVWPGPAGAVIRHNFETGRGAGLFYTDVDDWLQLVKRTEQRVNSPVRD